MRGIVGVLFSLVILGAGMPAHAVSVDDLRNPDVVTGLRQALNQGADNAIRSLGKPGGFLDNPQLRIPLPDRLQQAGDMLRKVGLGRYPDELETAMNRAAEAAVPEAKTLLVSAVKQMSISDAKAILQGGDDAATRYFERVAGPALTAKFQPVVHRSMEKVQVAAKVDAFAGKAAKLGLIDPQNAKLDDYVTHQALSGLFRTMAEQEKALRQDPVGATGQLARKIFQALK